jgi:hypothetical protein
MPPHALADPRTIRPQSSISTNVATISGCAAVGSDTAPAATMAASHDAETATGRSTAGDDMVVDVAMVRPGSGAVPGAAEQPASRSTRHPRRRDEPTKG